MSAGPWRPIRRRRWQSLTANLMRAANEWGGYREANVIKDVQKMGRNAYTPSVRRRSLEEQGAPFCALPNTALSSRSPSESS